MSKWVRIILKALPRKQVVDLVLGVIEDFVEDTDTDLDDAAFDIIRTVIYTGLKIDQ